MSDWEIAQTFARINSSERTFTSTRVSELAALAKELDVPLWVLFVPKLRPIDLTKEGAERLRKFVAHYIALSVDNRRAFEERAFSAA